MIKLFSHVIMSLYFNSIVIVHAAIDVAIFDTRQNSVDIDIFLIKMTNDPIELIAISYIS